MVIYLTGPDPASCYPVCMDKINITRANGTREVGYARDARCILDYIWEHGYPVDPEVTPEAIVTVSLENGDFVCREIVSYKTLEANWNGEEL